MTLKSTFTALVYALPFLSAGFVCAQIPENASTQTASTKYHVYRLDKPPEFGTLETFVRDTYGDAVDAATVFQTTIDKRPALTYWIDGAGIRDFSLLIDDGTALILMTTARLEITIDPIKRASETEDLSGSIPRSSTTNGASLRPMLTMIPGSCGSSYNGGNCVAYVRCLAPWLPSKDLTTFVAKKSLINSSVATVGAVAVIQVSGKFAINGHLAYITAVNYDSKGKVTTITIAESNFNPQPGFDFRTDTPSRLNIVGYIHH